MTSVLAIDHVQIAMPAGGEEAARKFYRDIVGLAELPKPAALATRGGCWFAIGGQQLHLGIDPDFRPARKAHVAMRVDGLTALRDRLSVAAFRVTDIEMIEDVPRFFSDDPFGNRIEFVGVVT